MAKTKFTVEYDLHGVPANLLWQFIFTPQSLELWFADEVRQDGKNYTFIWDGYPQEASLTSVRQGSYVRFHWKDDGKEHTFFELRIGVSELLDNKVLTITDFADSPEDVEDAKALWNHSVSVLKRNLGCS